MNTGDTMADCDMVILSTRNGLKWNVKAFEIAKQLPYPISYWFSLNPYYLKSG